MESMCNRSIMGYTDCLEVGTMKDLELFDDIPYKYIKKIIDCNDEVIDVEIEDLDCDILGYCKKRFTIELSVDVSRGRMPIMVDKKFVVEKEYNGSSCFALIMCNLYQESDDDDDDDE